MLLAVNVNTDLVFTIIIFTTVLLALVTGIMLTVLVASRQRSRQEVQLTEARLDYERELRQTEAEVQEATLAHIAAELHDNIGQLLTVMKLQIEKEKYLDPASVRITDPIAGTLKDTMQQVRLLSHSLSNDFINENGLQHIIGQEVQRLCSLGECTVHFDTDAVEPALSRDARTVAFRIFQEAVSNSLRHSNAANIFVWLRGQDRFCLQVRDDGVGFEMEKIAGKNHGLGLGNMMRRAMLTGLQCNIDTAPQQGCTFTVTALPQPSDSINLSL